MDDGLVQIIVALIGAIVTLSGFLINQVGKRQQLEKEKKSWQSNHRFRVMLSLPDINIACEWDGEEYN